MSRKSTRRRASSCRPDSKKSLRWPVFYVAEPLEQRLILSLVSLGDAAAALQQAGGVTSATIITPGFQSFGSRDAGWLNFADAIHQKAGGFLLDYQVEGQNQPDGFSDSDAVQGGLLHQLPDNVTGHNLVLLYDWAPESDQRSSGWAGAAGDALFSLLAGLNLVQPGVAGPPIDLHFIGHSFGCAVNSVAVEHLDAYHILVGQVTNLDPHDFDQGQIFDGDQQEFHLGRPSTGDLGEPSTADDGYGVTVWDNVQFEDTYYQTRGKNGAAVPSIVVPRGRPIPGSYNMYLDPTQLPSSYDLFDAGGDHSYLWDGFYLGTVLGYLPPGVVPPPQPPDWTATGFAYSELGQELAKAAGQTSATRPDPIFYTEPVIPQDHIYSSPALVYGNTGLPPASLPAGLTVAQIESGKWAPQWDPLSIADGNFQTGDVNDSTTGVGFEPGWSDHQGEGDGTASQSLGTIVTSQDGTNRFLNLDHDGPSRTHNLLFVPPNAAFLQFDMQLLFSSRLKNQLEVRLGETVVGDVSLSASDSPHELQTLPVAPDLNGFTQTLTLTLIAPPGGAIDVDVAVDNIRFNKVWASASDVIRKYNPAASTLVNDANAIADAGLGQNVPFLSEPISTGLALAADLQTPFKTQPGAGAAVAAVKPAPASAALSPAAGVDWATILQDLQDATFQINWPIDSTVAGTTDDNGDLLSMTWSKVWNTPDALFTASGKTGFPYLDDAGVLFGSIRAQVQSISLQVTVGVDVVHDLPTFFLSSSSGLSVNGISISANLSGNLDLGELGSVDAGVTAGLTIGTASIGFKDVNGNGKLRVADLQAGGTVAPHLAGKFEVAGSLTAHLSLLPSISWQPTFTETMDETGLHTPTFNLNPPDGKTLLS